MGAVPILTDHICGTSTAGSGACYPNAGTDLTDFPLPTPHHAPSEGGEGGTEADVGRATFALDGFNLFLT